VSRQGSVAGSGENNNWTFDFHKRRGIFLTGWVTVSSSRWSLLLNVGCRLEFKPEVSVFWLMFFKLLFCKRLCIVAALKLNQFMRIVQTWNTRRVDRLSYNSQWFTSHNLSNFIPNFGNPFRSNGHKKKTKEYDVSGYLNMVKAAHDCACSNITQTHVFFSRGGHKCVQRPNEKL
jgi:hypothetical protein